MAERSGSEHAHLDFALALHRAVAGTGGDSCVSPYSAASALGLTAQATRGPASAELVALLAGPGGELDAQARLLREASELAATGKQEEPVLEVSNTLWAWDELPLNSEFTDGLASWPGGKVASAPFVRDADGARRMINEDVAETTRDLIPELLAPEAVRADTVASIVNALYLKVAWVHKFREDGTEDADFHAPDGTRQVPTMRLKERVRYAAEHGWQAVGLPAVGGLQATILLPDNDLADQESTMDSEKLGALLDAHQDRIVDLALPKISLDVRSDLTRALGELGARTVFSPAADFGPLTDDPRLAVSNVQHQAVLRIDEQGLEGAAATAVMMRMVSMPAGTPVTVRVDRPFLLLVRHAATGAVYFLARVERP